MRSEWQQIQYQESLESILHNLFPSHRILSNTKKHIAITNATGEYFEVDVWLPELNLCFEFQDYYHYKPAWYNQTPLHIVQQQDNIKRHKLMLEHHTILLIPCWWLGDPESLQATIHFERPDLCATENNTEIACNPPQEFFTDHTQLMLAAFPKSMPPGTWWLGEKWDGIRCFWDATEKQLYSRYRVAIDVHLPDDLFGDIVLDAELWCGRGFFEESQEIALTTLTNIAFLRLVCFDSASKSTWNMTFETRYELMLSTVCEEHPVIINATRLWCCGDTVMQAMLHGVTVSGGEGIILRRPLSLYLPGQSDDLLKVKGLYMHSDQEALVVRVENDGTLLLQLPNGLRFSADKNATMLSKRAKQGDIVTFRVELASPLWYRDFQKSISAELLLETHSQPVVYRIRSDLSWQDVTTWDTSELSVGDLTAAQSTATQRSWKIIGDRRAFFDEFAVFQGMDSLNPVFWYNVTLQELLSYDKRYKSISGSYGGKLSTILVQLYPDIGLQHSQFKVQSWNDQSTSRQFFDKFAASKGMDALNPSFWATVTTSDLVSYDRRYRSIAGNYGGKLATVLATVYPDIGLKQNEFKINVRLLKHAKEKRAFFDMFAASKEMDPLNPVFWYRVTPLELARFDKRFKHMDTNLFVTLRQIYPNIGLQQTKFKEIQSWKQKSARKEYFDRFAASKGMDPLNPIFWQGVTTSELKQFNKGLGGIVRHYGGKLSTALTQLYPSIGLSDSQFNVTVQSWKHKTTRRAFFDKFAAFKGMDPLNPSFWYRVTPRELLKYNKIFQNLYPNYKGKLATMLIQLYPDIGLQQSLFKG